MGQTMQYPARQQRELTSKRGDILGDWGWPGDGRRDQMGDYNNLMGQSVKQLKWVYCDKSKDALVLGLRRWQVREPVHLYLLFQKKGWM